MRFALGISYDGTAYHGWQKQAEHLTLQATLERALSQIADHAVTVTCAGRTDKGVHALGQVVHFDTQSHRTNRAWQLGTNSLLPPDIRVEWIQEVAEQFHARFSAKARKYVYIILNQSSASALGHRYVMHCSEVLHVDLMQYAADYLLGEHDFTSFRGADCQSRSTVRTVYACKVYQRDQSFIHIEITANAFLQHMVRIIVGSLITIGTGAQEPSWMQAVLLAKDRQRAGSTAKANGLYLLDVLYRESLPKPRSICPFLRSSALF